MKHQDLLSVYGGLLFLLALVISCGPKPLPNVPPDTDQCAAACEHLRELGCEEGKPLEDGTSCEKFCEDTQNSGHWLNPTCVKDIMSCSEIDACGEH